jgi:hypothetical protein
MSGILPGIEILPQIAQIDAEFIITFSAVSAKSARNKSHILFKIKPIWQIS